MGILESLKRTGLLEDTRLAIELRVSQAFEWARRVLRAACRLPPPPTSLHNFLPSSKLQQLQQQQPQQQRHQKGAGQAPALKPSSSSSQAVRHSAFGSLDADLSIDPENKAYRAGGGWVKGRAAQLEFTGVLTSPGLAGQPQVGPF